MPVHKVRLTVLKEGLYYAGRNRRKGEVIEASHNDSKLLKLLKSAEDAAPETRPVGMVESTAPAPAPGRDDPAGDPLPEGQTTPAAPEAFAPSGQTDVKVSKTKVKGGGGRYATRDLKAGN